MATVPAASATVRVTSLTAKPASWASKSTWVSGVKLAAVFPRRAVFPSLRTSRLQVCCEAKPETVDKCMEVIRSTLALSADTSLTPQTSFNDLGADSLDTVEVVMALEETFDITVAEDSAQTIATVQDAANLIEQLVEQKAAAA